MTDYTDQRDEAHLAVDAAFDAMEAEIDTLQTKKMTEADAADSWEEKAEHWKKLCHEVEADLSKQTGRLKNEINTLTFRIGELQAALDRSDGIPA